MTTRTRLTAAVATTTLVIAAAGSPSATAATANPAWAWGANGGRLGNGTTDDRWVAVPVSGLLPYKEISGGGYHSLAVTPEGEVRAWGFNWEGQLGDASTTDRTTPVAVGWVSGVRSVAAGYRHSVAAKGDGTVWAWGQNDYGQLGDGTTTDRSIPGPAHGLSNVVQVGAGYVYSLALTGSGEIWGWGTNWSGQLGNGEVAGFDSDPSPAVRALTPAGMRAISAGSGHALAIASDGAVWSWGSNYAGQLGDGTTTENPTPRPVEGLRDVVDIAAGYSHSLAVTRDGQVWRWGSRGWWIDDAPYPRPEPLAGLANVVDVAAGEDFSLALKADGTIWGWGHNSYGQLGADFRYATPTPVRVKGLTGATAVSAGFYHSLALAPAQEAPVPVQSVGYLVLTGVLGLGLVGGRRRRRSR